MMQHIVLFIHLILSFTLIGLVLLQHGKGADAGAAFGSGSSGTVFGSQGTGTFLSKLTTIIACLFAVTSISLTLLANRAAKPETLSDRLIKQEAVVTTPAAPTEIPVAPPAAETTTQ
jgi:preprotein translocase subunit SecG